jgi:hypothetical protein
MFQTKCVIAGWLLAAALPLSGQTAPAGGRQRETQPGSQLVNETPTSKLIANAGLNADSAGYLKQVAGNNLMMLSESGEMELLASSVGSYGDSLDAQVRDAHTHSSADGSLSTVDELMDGMEGVDGVSLTLSVQQLLTNETFTASFNYTVKDAGATNSISSGKPAFYAASDNAIDNETQLWKPRRLRSPDAGRSKSPFSAVKEMPYETQ